MNAIGYIVTALIVLACTGYLLLAPVWGRKKPPTPKWGRNVPPAPKKSNLVWVNNTVRPQSAARMRSVRHETRKPRSPVRAVPEPRTPTHPLRTCEEDAGLDVSTLLAIGLLSNLGSSNDSCAPSDSSGGSDSGGCDSGADGGGGGGGSD